MKKMILALSLSGALLGATPLYAEEMAAAPSAPVAAAVETAPVATDTAAAPTVAAEAAPAEAAPAAEPAPVMDKGDVAWMMTATMLVILMTIPGLALFYGGLVRAKNMLSVLMQVFSVFALITILWCIYGYSLAFCGGGAYIGTLDKIFLSGITKDTMAATFSAGFQIPELIFVAFQATFAAISCALIVGAFAERIKFSAVLVFSILWFTFSYIPIAHMVWYGDGFLFKAGAIDFAGGTVVHINAGVAALVGAYMVGKRVGYGKEAMAPHNMVMTMIGASMLWVGWFGFNAGSNLEANGGAALAFLNTILATAAAALAWAGAETLVKGKPSMLGAASGAVAGLVAITPACGTIGPMGAILLGLISGVVCLWAVHGLKRIMNVDDSLDVFGIHGIGGIIGAVLTGVFTAPSLGGTGAEDFSIASQVLIQTEGVVITILWSGIVSIILFKLVDIVIGLRVPEEEERIGLDVTSHGERAYNN